MYIIFFPSSSSATIRHLSWNGCHFLLLQSIFHPHNRVFLSCLYVYIYKYIYICIYLYLCPFIHSSGLFDWTLVNPVCDALFPLLFLGCNFHCVCLFSFFSMYLSHRDNCNTKCTQPQTQMYLHWRTWTVPIHDGFKTLFPCRLGLGTRCIS